MIDALPLALRRAVSPYTGIVRSVEECLCSTSEPAFFQASCDIGHGASLLGAELRHLSGLGGAGKTRSDAAAAAVGEAVERYSATYVPPERLLVATARELGGAAVEPARFALFSDAQHDPPGFPYRRFTADTRVAWVEGRELPAGRPRFLPAELVFLGKAWLDEGPIGYTTSSGLACDHDGDETIVRGLCELLERDAFMVVWSNRLSLPRLEGSPDLWRRPFDRAGLEFAAVDLSVFHGVPTVLGIVRAPVGVPGALGVGAAAAATIERAWWKALSEAFATRTAAAKLLVLETAREFGPHGIGVDSFEDHILYYGDHANLDAAAFLDASEESTPVDTVEPLEGRTARERIAALCGRVEAAGSSAYAVDVTSPDVAALGLSVTRVVAPELCPLEVSHSARFLGGTRLYEAAAAIGLRPDVLCAAAVNPDPHPFP